MNPLSPSFLRFHQASQKGFTLIELMVALVVVSILLSVAVPGFMDKLRQARRADAVDISTQVAQAQERWRANNPAYSTNLVADLNLSATSSGGFYTQALSGVSGSTYVLTVTAVAGKSQAQDGACATLAMSVTNGSAVYAPAACWSR